MSAHRYLVKFITEAAPNQWRVTGFSASRPLVAADLDALADALTERMGAAVALIDVERAHEPEPAAPPISPGRRGGGPPVPHNGVRATTGPPRPAATPDPHTPGGTR
jgi:hypothetical protein